MPLHYSKTSENGFWGLKFWNVWSGSWGVCQELSLIFICSWKFTAAHFLVIVYYTIAGFCLKVFDKDGYFLRGNNFSSKLSLAKCYDTFFLPEVQQKRENLQLACMHPDLYRRKKREKIFFLLRSSQRYWFWRRRIRRNAVSRRVRFFQHFFNRKYLPSRMIWCLELELIPTHHFTTLELLKQCAQSTRTTQNSPIYWFLGSQNVKGPVRYFWAE